MPAPRSLRERRARRALQPPAHSLRVEPVVNTRQSGARATSRTCIFFVNERHRANFPFLRAIVGGFALWCNGIRSRRSRSGTATWRRGARRALRSRSDRGAGHNTWPFQRPALKRKAEKREMPQGLWQKCPGCSRSCTDRAGAEPARLPALRLSLRPIRQGGDRNLLDPDRLCRARRRCCARSIRLQFKAWHLQGSAPEISEPHRAADAVFKRVRNDRGLQSGDRRNGFQFSRRHDGLGLGERITRTIEYGTQIAARSSLSRRRAARDVRGMLT